MSTSAQSRKWGIVSWIQVNGPGRITVRGTQTTGKKLMGTYRSPAR